MSSLLSNSASGIRNFQLIAKLGRKIPLKNGGFWTENLRASRFFRNFVVSIRNTADTLKSQPDTRAGKPNKQQL